MMYVRDLLQQLKVAAIAATLGCAVIIAPPSAAQQKPKEPESPAQLKKRQAEVLEGLFARLARAEDKEKAEVLEKAVWQIWLRSGSDTVDVLMQQSIKAMNDERMDAALAILDVVTEIAPSYPEGWNKRATVLYVQQQYEASLRDIAKVLELEPRHFGALSGKGLIRRAQGKDAEALEAFRDALKVHPFLEGAEQAIKELKIKVEGQGI